MSDRKIWTKTGHELEAGYGRKRKEVRGGVIGGQEGWTLTKGSERWEASKDLEDAPREDTDPGRCAPGRPLLRRSTRPTSTISVLI